MANLQSLQAAIAQAKQEKEEEEKEDAARRRAERQEKEKFWKAEEEQLEEKVKLAEQIFDWAREFAATEEYAHLRDVPLRSGVIIYYGGWGHTHEGGYGCWSRMYLGQTGSLTYCSGFKGMGVSGRFFTNQSETLAKKLSFNYLDKLANHISSGEVYETLKQHKLS